MDQVLGEAVLDVELGSLTLPVSVPTNYSWLLSYGPLTRTKVLLPDAVRWTPAIFHAIFHAANEQSDVYKNLVDSAHQVQCPSNSPS
jgi:hypothetical protein